MRRIIIQDEIAIDMGLLRFNDLFKAVSCYDLIFSGVGWEVSFACIISLIYFSGSHSNIEFFIET